MPAQQLGSGAVEMLMHRRNDGRVRRVVFIPPVLTVRGSSAAVPKTSASPDTGERDS
jgi:DNA-binding LacI/PurR family transcriptional regulator